MLRWSIKIKLVLVETWILRSVGSFGSDHKIALSFRGMVERVCALACNAQIRAFTRFSAAFINGRLKCCFMSTETVGLLGTGAQDVHLDFHTAPEL